MHSFFIDKRDMILLYYAVHAGVVEWQTRRTQNPLVAIPCRFKSDHRHHPGTQQMIEGILSEVESLVYLEARNPLINKGILPFLTLCFSAVWITKSPHIPRSGCLSENTSKSSFEIVWHYPGVCIFPSNSLALTVLLVIAWFFSISVREDRIIMRKLSCD